MSFDHLNSQPLGFGVGHFQTSFGFGDEGGDALPDPFIFEPEEDVFESVSGIAIPAEGPKLSGLLLQDDLFNFKIPVGSSVPLPKIFSLRLLDGLRVVSAPKLGTYKKTRQLLGRLFLKQKRHRHHAGTRSSSPRITSATKVDKKE